MDALHCKACPLQFRDEDLHIHCRQDEWRMSNNYNEAGVSPETFQQIIRERKSEVKDTAKQKRDLDFKRIREMKSKEGRSPVEIFPKELWALILENVDPEDRGNIWKVHDQFRDLMSSKHVVHNLFPQILKFNVEEFWASDFGEEDDEELYRAPLAFFMELRRVSKSLRSRVDLFLEEDLLKRILNSDIMKRPEKSICFKFMEPELLHMKKLDEFLAFTESNSKSLVSRSLDIMMDSFLVILPHFQESFEQLKNKIKRILENVGQHIWHFSFDCLQSLDAENNLTKVYLALMEWLPLMPNVKWLQIRLMCNGNVLCTSCIDGQVIRSHPPPKLDNLQRLDFTNLHSTTPHCQQAKETVCIAFLEANPHIKNLHLSGYGAQNVLSSSPPSFSLEYLGLGDAMSVISWIPPFVGLENVVNFKWPLKQLRLELDLENHSIVSLFEFVQKFQYVEDLHLVIKNATVGNGEMDFLRLPNLEELYLDITFSNIDYNSPLINFFFSLQFLLHSKGLKNLGWKCRNVDFDKLKSHLEKNRRPGGMIDFEAGWSGLSRSNLYQVFQYLEYVWAEIEDGSGNLCRLGDTRRNRV